ncbi:hypothetical protein WJ96_07545 [Burkholderia ubonensis]|uniref:Uncharacterized protein n=1 Tax=Burkholderia ubonensis TaxID=101571 RepID=A0AAW3MX58_9BURK|nr:hypothetical protein [Burkholderia ubonensis]KVP75551.1 hypothetical protein WJ93_09335 [Burkholderia ubonensis]KVP97015.1 hypothetical protein WJ97_14445 [Burkholderia ubonensis]KVP98365.1 hypothetical protein WJ96_07545 [Burkholderia ubonensis]KVZ93063.1 hypothetical protein WL25_19205 [Burkholderia ubonensis]
MTSHAEYIKDQDEAQLSHLIELATKRRDDLIHGGWTRSWVVADYCNKGWFPHDKYADAVEFLCLLAKLHAKNGETHELSLEEGRYRPAEAARLFAETEEESARLAKSLA